MQFLLLGRTTCCASAIAQLVVALYTEISTRSVKDTKSSLELYSLNIVLQHIYAYYFISVVEIFSFNSSEIE